MKNLFATIGFITVIVGAYSIGEKIGYKKAVREVDVEFKKLTRKFVDEGLMREPCESKQSEE